MAKNSKLSFMNDFDKEIDKAGISSEDTPPKYWYSSGNYVLNKIISNSFKRGIPQGRVTALVGPSGCLPAGEKVTIYKMRSIRLNTPIKFEGGIPDELVGMFDQLSSRDDPSGRLLEYLLQCDGVRLKKTDGILSHERVDQPAVKYFKLTTQDKLCEMECYLEYPANLDINNPADVDRAFEEHCQVHSELVNIESLTSSLPVECMLVSTPDGFQPISQLFIKQPRPIYQISTDAYQLRCSNDHLLETSTGWRAADQLTVGDIVITVAGDQAITSITVADEEPVYDFEVAHENHRYWSGGFSSHNSGKSYLSANFVKNAQQNGAFILVLDSENALDSEFMSKIGVNTEEDYSYRQVDTIGDVIKVVSSFMKKYREAYPDGDGPEVLILLDSLDMLSTESEVEKFQKGDNSGDQGQRPKQFKAFNRQMVREIKGTNVSMVVTGQVYQATREQLMKGEGVWVVNDAIRYAYSQIILVTKLKLKDDKTKAVTGVRIKAQGFKTRFAKPFQEVELEVPYDTGMDPLSGLLETAIALGIVTQRGSRYSLTGSDESWYSKDLAKYADQILEAASKFDSLHVSSGIDEETNVESQSEVTKRRKSKLDDQDDQD